MRSLVVLLCLAGVFQLGTAVNSSNPCEGILTGIVFDPNVCYQYIICNRYQAEVITCPPGTIFSVAELDCVPGNQRTCVEGPEDDRCRGIVLGRLPDPNNCTSFHNCILGQAHAQTCREGFVFSQKAFICLPGDAETCEVEINLPTTPAPEDIEPIPIEYCLVNQQIIGRLPHPQFCTRFVRCRLWIPEDMACPDWMVFNKQLQICVPGNPNTCRTLGDLINPPTAQPPITNDICPEKLIALVPHPYQCYKFVSCVLGKATEQECPPYHVFSKERSLCLPGNQKTCTIVGQ